MEKLLSLLLRDENLYADFISNTKNEVLKSFRDRYLPKRAFDYTLTTFRETKEKEVVSSSQTN